uniref:Uncharacterized protein n=1 Tax=Arundo donax TaxID=35708 RepID=A0A0A9ADL0_ARUDO
MECWCCVGPRGQLSNHGAIKPGSCNRIGYEKK